MVFGTKLSFGIKPCIAVMFDGKAMHVAIWVATSLGLIHNL